MIVYGNEKEHGEREDYGRNEDGDHCSEDPRLTKVTRKTAGAIREVCRETRDSECEAGVNNRAERTLVTTDTEAKKRAL